MRVLVTGKVGQVVTSIEEIAKNYDCEIIKIGRPEVDLADFDKLEKAIISAAPDVVISAAAYTLVDKAESEQDLAMAINGKAPKAIASATKKLNIPLIHISTDYVFNGEKSGAYKEDDETAPIGIYGKTKLVGEQEIAAITDNYVILRTAWVYSPFGNNFVKTMLRLSETRDELNVVADQNGCPTYALEIARACLEVAQKITSDSSKELRGIFHLAAQGKANWAEFAKKIFELSGKNVQVNEITTEEYPTPAKRPKNSLLSSEKLTKIYGITLDNWEKSLAECLAILNK